MIEYIKVNSGVKPKFEFISKKKNPGYAKNCHVCYKGTIHEIRCYGLNLYYRTIEGFSYKFRTLHEAMFMINAI